MQLQAGINAKPEKARHLGFYQGSERDRVNGSPGAYLLT
jgi:hypothetical protein